ncbi:MAG: hypothetical protein M0Q40_04975 [Limnochordia bacterium]|jgi:hypothetical protein|nr:hypothetical protein [Limnochordia bacterium]MDD4517183.1 hypothetical protein [Limnochordia bacterium]
MKPDKAQSRINMLQQAIISIKQDPNQNERFKERGLRVLEKAYEQALRELDAR